MADLISALDIVDMGGYSTLSGAERKSRVETTGTAARV